MRPLDEPARLWNDALRPRSSWLRTSWSWPVAAAAGGLLLTLAGTGLSQVPAETTARAAVTAASPVNCQGQTWPFLSEDCLQRDEAAKRQVKPVRVVHHEPETAAAAIGATSWAPKAVPSSRQAPSRQATREPRQPRTVTVRSGRDRNAAPQRVYVVPSDSAYRAYGYAPR